MFGRAIVFCKNCNGAMVGCDVIEEIGNCLRVKVECFMCKSNYETFFVVMKQSWESVNGDKGNEIDYIELKNLKYIES
jgi:hypothetical protein